ncbi:MAG: 50S ribosomal protein L25 [Syntrophobacteraceae bacterium]|nr:50S ribosomal protein L25 [Syntrophobacteraceae bacterium]
MEYEISASVRGKIGKGAARGLRRESLVPAVLYGPKMDPMTLSVSSLQLEKLLRSMEGESRLVTISIEDGGASQTHKVLLREVQVHPFRRRFLHVDFFEAPLDRRIVVNVPIELKGDSIGVRKGGSINLILRTLAVRCLPAEIPERIYVDVSALDLGSTITTAGLAAQVPQELMGEPSQAVVTVVAPEIKAKEGEAARAK